MKLTQTCIISSFVLFTLNISLNALAVGECRQYFPGDGSSSNPYVVTTAAQFQNVWRCPDASFRQDASIDLNGLSVNMIGTTALPFTGNYDGNGKEIRNFSISRPTENAVGLFRSVGTSGFINHLRVIGTLVEGQQDVGLLVGRSSGWLNNVAAYGAVRGKTNVGLVAGSINGIQSGATCLSRGRIELAAAGGYVTTQTNGGGILGTGQCAQVRRVNVENSNIYGSQSVGGVAGSFRGELFNARSVANFISGTGAGGVAGRTYAPFSLVDGRSGKNTIRGMSILGGLIGDISGGTISRSFVVGAEMRTLYGTAGGFYGEAGEGASIENSSARAHISAPYLTDHSASACNGGFGGAGWKLSMNKNFSATTFTEEWVPGQTNGNHPIFQAFLGCRGYAQDVNYSANVYDQSITNIRDAYQAASPRTTAEMQSINTYLQLGWDFISIWIMPALGYAELRR